MSNGLTPSVRLGSGEMFDRIAQRYDFVNRVMTFGMDRRWRKLTTQALNLQPGQRVLDVATGTGDLALTVADSNSDVQIDGIDPSENMLKIAQEKVEQLGLAARVTLARGYAESLPYPDATFDAVTVAFGIRNVAERDKALREMARVTKPGGRLAVLEAMEPRNGFIAPFARFYVRHILPILGGTLSTAREYRYLEESMLAFPAAPEFVEQLNRTGWRSVSVRSFAFGACQLFVAEAR